MCRYKHIYSIKPKVHLQRISILAYRHKQHSCPTVSASSCCPSISNSTHVHLSCRMACYSHMNDGQPPPHFLPPLYFYDNWCSANAMYTAAVYYARNSENKMFLQVQNRYDISVFNLHLVEAMNAEPTQIQKVDYIYINIWFNRYNQQIQQALTHLNVLHNLCKYNIDTKKSI